MMPKTSKMAITVASEIMRYCTITISDSDFNDMLEDNEIDKKHKEAIINKLYEIGVIDSKEWPLKIDHNTRTVKESINRWCFYNT